MQNETAPARACRSSASAGRLVLVVAFVLLLAPLSAAASVTVKDFTGHPVTLAAPAKRIVALTPHLVANLFTVGLGARVVGAVDYSNYPPAAKAIPRVGGYRSLSLEAIVAKKPDLVVAWGEAGTGDLVARLRQFGIPVYVDNPKTFAGIARTLRDLGTLGGTEATANVAASAFTARMTALKKKSRVRRSSVRVGRLVLVVAFVLLFTPLSAAASVTVKDFTGHPVTLAAPAKRIVALTPHLVANLFTVGLGARVVGAVDYSNYPPAAKAIPRVGGYRSLSLEAIVAKKPDLVVAWGEAGTGDLVARLRQFGIPVYVDNPKTFAGIARTLRDLGTLGGTEATANAAASAFTARMTALKKKYADQTPVPVFYAVSVDPLITISGQTMIGAAIRLCGGRNIYAEAPTAAPRVSIESLIARDPAAIIASAPAGTHPDWAKKWQRWPALSAVARDRFVTVPRSAMSQPTVRMAKATTVLCQGIARVRREIEPDESRPQ